MTKKKRKELVERTKEWVQNLKLEHWNIDIFWRDKPLQGKEEVAAWVERDFDYQRAQIYVVVPLYERTEKEFSEEWAFRYIVHELMHIVLAQYDMLLESPYKTEQEYDRIREQTTELLTRIVMDLE